MEQAAEPSGISGHSWSELEVKPRPGDVLGALHTRCQHVLEAETGQKHLPETFLRLTQVRERGPNRSPLRILRAVLGPQGLVWPSQPGVHYIRPLH